MTDQELFSVLIRWNYWDKGEIPDLIRRREVEFLHRYFSGNLVQIIKGPRRAGKSSILKVFYNDLRGSRDPLSFLFINLEDVSLAQEESSPQLLERLYRLYRQRVNPSGKAIVFIDEAQRISGWERWVETYREIGEAKFFITGSSSKLSSKELGTLLTGRHIDLTLYPFSFRDFVASRGFGFDELSLYAKKDQIKNLLFSYFETGGFPEVLLNYGPDEGMEILETYFDDMIYRDIVERWGVRDVQLLKRIALYALKNSGNLMTYRQLQRLIEQVSGKTSTNTISEHMSHLIEAYIVFELTLYSNSIKKSIQRPRKLYSVDTGLRKAVVKPFTDDFGRDAENVVFIELLRRRYKVNYWRNNETEVDFIALGRKRNLAINVTMSNIERKDLRVRELKGLVDFPGKEFERILITDDLEDELKIEGKKITLLPLWKWLLLEQ